MFTSPSLRSVGKKRMPLDCLAGPFITKIEVPLVTLVVNVDVGPRHSAFHT